MGAAVGRGIFVGKAQETIGQTRSLDRSPLVNRGVLGISRPTRRQGGNHGHEGRAKGPGNRRCTSTTGNRFGHRTERTGTTVVVTASS